MVNVEVDFARHRCLVILLVLWHFCLLSSLLLKLRVNYIGLASYQLPFGERQQTIPLQELINWLKGFVDFVAINGTVSV